MTLDETILALVSKREVISQSAFLDLLKRAGHDVTQPTLSRHVRKLGIRKVAGHYQKMGTTPAEMPSFTLMPVPPSLLVIRTQPGYAQPLAVRLDENKITGVAGTLAGDDTVFIAVTPPPSIEAVAEAVDSLLSGYTSG